MAHTRGRQTFRQSYRDSSMLHEINEMLCIANIANIGKLFVI